MPVLRRPVAHGSLADNAAMRLDPTEARRRAADDDHGVLATFRAGQSPDLVPACFVLEGDLVAIPVDTVKTKGSTDLQRSRNLAADPRATLLVEHWDAVDWSRLWWVRLRLERSAEDDATTARLTAALRARYPQYRDLPFAAVLTFRIREVTGWSAS
jgi:PPOX class probable F420-dependent enzyme